MSFPPDLQIAQAASLKPLGDVAAAMGIGTHLLEAYGENVAKIKLDALDELADGKQATSVGGLHMDIVDVPRLEGQADLNVEITRSANSLNVIFRYDTGIFDESTIRRLLNSFIRLIELAVADPAVPVSVVSLLTPDERAQMLAFATGATAVAPEQRA